MRSSLERQIQICVMGRFVGYEPSANGINLTTLNEKIGFWNVERQTERTQFGTCTAIKSKSNAGTNHVMPMMDGRY